MLVDNCYIHTQNDNMRNVPQKTNYYIRHTKDENKITWIVNLKKQKFTLIPKLNSIYLHLDLAIKTNNYLPNECYLVDIIFGGIEISNLNLIWKANDTFNGIVRFLYDGIIMVDSQNNYFSENESIPLQFRFKLNAKMLDGLDLDDDDINQLNTAMLGATNFNFQVNAGNLAIVNKISSGIISFVKGYIFSNNQINTISEKYYYKIMSENVYQPFEIMHNIVQLAPTNDSTFFNLNNSIINFDFFYRDNRHVNKNEYHIKIEEPRFFIKKVDDQNVLMLPKRMIYKNDGTFLQANESDDGGFYLPNGGSGNLLVTIDFVLNNLAKKIIFKIPFMFKNSFDCIKVEIKNEQIKNLTNFKSIGEVEKDA